MGDIIQFPGNRITTPTVDAPIMCEPPARTEFRGSKYAETRDLDITDIAKLVRADIKAAIKTGSLPDIKASVRIERFSGGQSLNVQVTSVSVPVANPDFLRIHRETGRFPWGDVPMLNETGNRIRETLEGIVSQYNRDNSDTMTDYFDVRFYSHVNIDSNLVYNGG